MSSKTLYSDYDPGAWLYNKEAGPELINATLPHLEELLLSHLPKEAHILDLGCGSGQLAQHLLRKRYKVTESMDQRKCCALLARMRRVVNLSLLTHATLNFCLSLMRLFPQIVSSII